MTIDNVMLEVTRKCNLRCGHCLRGAAQNKSMSMEVMHAAIIKAKYINTLSFGGGEPSLAAKQISEAAMIARINENVGGFFLVTNGRYAPPEFLQSLREMYIASNCDEYTSICYSDDQYHDLKPKPQVLDKIRNVIVDFGVSMMSEDSWLYPKTHGRGISTPIIMGRSRWGKELETESCDYYFELDNMDSDPEDISMIDGMFYVNVNGDVFPSCDLSYKAQNNPLYKIGNVLDADFSYHEAGREWNRRLKEGVVGSYFHD